jgi:AcrR family transcriptional regulator
MSAQEDRPRRGRQAEAARNDLRVLQAAREAFATDGATTTVATIAKRAGVGVGSLYRRYGSKDDLLRHTCLLSMQQSIEAVQTALEDPDAWAGLSRYVQACVDQGTGALAPLAGTIDTTPEMWNTARKGRRALERLVARAHDQGALRRDATALDIAWLIELFGRTAPGQQDETARRRLLAVALDGLRPPAAGRSLPAPAPSVRRYEGRWRRPNP